MGKQVPLEPYWFDVAFVEVDLRCSLVYLIGHVGLIFFFFFFEGAIFADSYRQFQIFCGFAKALILSLCNLWALNG